MATLNQRVAGSSPAGPTKQSLEAQGTQETRQEVPGGSLLAQADFAAQMLHSGTPAGESWLVQSEVGLHSERRADVVGTVVDAQRVTGGVARG